MGLPRGFPTSWPQLNRHQQLLVQRGKAPKFTTTASYLHLASTVGTFPPHPLLMAVASQGHSLEPTVGEEGTLSRKPTMVVSDPDASRTVETFGVVREQNALLLRHWSRPWASENTARWEAGEKALDLTAGDLAICWADFSGLSDQLSSRGFRTDAGLESEHMCVLLEIEPRASCIQGKHSSTISKPQEHECVQVHTRVHTLSHPYPTFLK